MADPLRSVDRAYYGSRKPLDLRGTREGRKNPVPVPSYQHRGNDVTASSSKYYAAVVPVQAAPPRPAKLSTIRLESVSTLLAQVVAGFDAGATEILVYGAAELISQARVVVDSAVGRNALTREQADVVAFSAISAPVVVAAESDTAVVTVAAPVVVEAEAPVEVEVPAEAEAPIEAEVSVEAELPEAEAPVTAPLTADVELLAEAEALMSAPTSKKSARKKAKKAESKDITEADVAAAFGVDDDSDD